MKFKLKKFWPIIVIVLLFILVSVGYAYYAESYRINRGENIIVDAVDTLRYRVFNLSSILDYFIPHKTLEEWSAFKGSVESGSLSDLEIQRIYPLRIVVTNTQHNGNFESIDPNKTWWESANDFCQDDVNTDDNSQWAALLWGYSGGERYLPQQVIYKDYEYVNSGGGTLFIATGDNQVSENLSNSVSGYYYVWTGYSNPGFDRTCINWSSASSAKLGKGGRAVYTDHNWLNQRQINCDYDHVHGSKPYLYCVELPPAS
ncbi:hypothetical protein KKF32_04680 [Patescibacteria group bacterium]|nr:hypothetical protein [Patescibacteria group bacterium]